MHAHCPDLTCLEEDAIESNQFSYRNLHALWMVCRRAEIDLWYFIAIHVTHIAYAG